MSRLVQENLTDRALRFNLVLEDVSITHVALSSRRGEDDIGVERINDIQLGR